MQRQNEKKRTQLGRLPLLRGVLVSIKYEVSQSYKLLKKWTVIIILGTLHASLTSVKDGRIYVVLYLLVYYYIYITYIKLPI